MLVNDLDSTETPRYLFVKLAIQELRDDLPVARPSPQPAVKMVAPPEKPAKP
jgi:hypothetical protein